MLVVVVVILLLPLHVSLLSYALNYRVSILHFLLPSFYSSSSSVLLPSWKVSLDRLMEVSWQDIAWECNQVLLLYYFSSICKQFFSSHFFALRVTFVIKTYGIREDNDFLALQSSVRERQRKRCKDGSFLLSLCIHMRRRKRQTEWRFLVNLITNIFHPKSQSFLLTVCDVLSFKPLSFSFSLSLVVFVDPCLCISLTSLPCFFDTKIHPVSLFFFWSVILFLVFSPDGRRLTPLFICLHGLIRSSLCLVFYLLSLSRNDMLWTRKFPKYYPFYMSLSSLSLYLTGSLRCRRALREILASFPLRSLLVFHSRA